MPHSTAQLMVTLQHTFIVLPGRDSLEKLGDRNHSHPPELSASCVVTPASKESSAQEYQIPQSQRVQEHSLLRFKRPIRSQCDVTKATVSSDVVRSRTTREDTTSDETISLAYLTVGRGDL